MKGGDSGNTEVAWDRDYAADGGANNALPRIKGAKKPRSDVVLQ
jgi:hypothetical protein